MSHPALSSAPDACAVAFKEWAGVCDALADGRQCLLLRKGGIAEGPGGFRPEHPAFWLYPTAVHQAEQGLRVPVHAPPADRAERVGLRALAVVAEAAYIDREDALAALERFHVWTSETVSRRFHYRAPGLWVLGVRVYRRAEPWPIPIAPEHAGCKTWVPLDAPPPTSGLVPALDDAEFTRQMAELRAASGASAGAGAGGFRP